MLKNLTAKRQKKSNNKGFSLVELIVVIAIMAVLVGVLAPTLIKNVEKSRESKDVQNLAEIQRAIVTAMANESAYDKIGGGGTFTVTTDGNGLTGTPNGTGATALTSTDAFNKEFLSILKPAAMVSKSVKNQTITARITADGTVTVGVYKDGESVSGNAISSSSGVIFEAK